MQAQPLPHNDYAEMIAIGCLIERYNPDEILAELVPEDFYGAANRIIFSACREISAAGGPVGHTTIIDQLRKDGNLEKVGGEDYLARCMNQVVSQTQSEGAIWGVRDSALLRNAHMATSNAAREFANPSNNATELIGDLQTTLAKISSRDKENQTQSMNKAMQEVVAKIDTFKGNSIVSGVPTGFRTLDFYTGGLQKSELVILAARPSMGKTSLMLDIAKYASMHNSRVYIFTLEMSKQQLAMRLICSQAMVDSHKVRTGQASSSEHGLLASAAANLSGCKMLLNDSANDLMEIIATAKREHEYGHLNLICIDYLQLIYTRFARGENRDREIGIITRQLKALAKELDIPILCLSQLSRVNEHQANKRPTLASLRDSGNIEQDADTVLFIHSDDYYDRESEGGEQRQEWKTDVIIAKQRNGPTEDLPFLFKRQFTRFFAIDTKKTEAPPLPEYQQN